MAELASGEGGSEDDTSEQQLEGGGGEEDTERTVSGGGEMRTPDFGDFGSGPGSQAPSGGGGDVGDGNAVDTGTDRPADRPVSGGGEVRTPDFADFDNDGQPDQPAPADTREPDRPMADGREPRDTRDEPVRPGGGAVTEGARRGDEMVAAAEAAGRGAVERARADTDQGVEEGGGPEGRFSVEFASGETATGSAEFVAQQIEQRFLEANPEFGPGDVRVVVSGGSFELEFTASGERKAAVQGFDRQLATVFGGREVDVGPEDVERTPEGFKLAGDAFDALVQNRRDIQFRLAGVAGAGGRFSPTRVASLFSFERAQRVGAAEELTERDRGARGQADVPAPILGSAFELSARDPGLEGRTFLGARSDLERRLESQIEERSGEEVDLDPRTDIEYAIQGGKLTASLSPTGLAKARSAGLSADIEALEERFGFDIPGEGPLVRTVATSPRDFGQRDIVIPAAEFDVTEGPLAGLFPGSEFLGAGVDIELSEGEVTFEDAAESLQGGLFEATELKPVSFPDPAPGRAGEATRIERREFTGAGRQPVAQFSQGVLRSPALIPSGAVAIKDVAEFQLEVEERLLAGDVEGATEMLEGGVATAQEGALLVSADFSADPGKFVAGGAGQLVGSGLIFGGAAAIGPRASLATRAVIQPGEEALGIGGFAVTRRISPGVAERAFPGTGRFHREPLIFSEEAALRTASRVGGRARRGARAAGGRARREFLSTRFRTAELMAADVPTRPTGFRFRLERRRKELEFRIAELNPRSEVRRPRTGRTEDRGQVNLGMPPAVEGETEVRGIFGFDVEAETETGAESEAMVEARRRLETATGGDVVVGEMSMVAEDLGFEQEPALEQRPMLDLRLGEIEAFDTEFDTEVEPLEKEFEFEIARPRLAQRTEAEEIELEQEFEVGQEVTARELEIEPLHTGGDRRRRPPAFIAGFFETQEVAQVGSVAGLLGFDIPETGPAGEPGVVTGGIDLFEAEPMALEGIEDFVVA